MGYGFWLFLIGLLLRIATVPVLVQAAIRIPAVVCLARVVRPRPAAVRVRAAVHQAAAQRVRVAQAAVRARAHNQQLLAEVALRCLDIQAMINVFKQEQAKL